MRAMILAAGRGDRMGALTQHTPKPLLEIGGKPLIVWHLERLAKQGFREIVINHAYLGEQLLARLQDGGAWGLRIRWSDESGGALETAGGIAKALPMFEGEPFWVVNADIWCDFSAFCRQLNRGDLAHLVLVNNPQHHMHGDFRLRHGRVIETVKGQCLTFSGIGLYHPSLFGRIAHGMHAKLGPLLGQAVSEDKVSGEHYQGHWADIGTPQRLALLEKEIGEPESEG